MADWRRALLKTLGMPVTKPNLQFLANWQRWEGGHTNNDARFNWLNTTRDAPGAVGEINSVGVKRFKSFKHGIQATAATLSSGRYDDILAALSEGDPYQYDISSGLQVWVSGRPDGNPGYAQKVLGGRGGSKRLPSPGAPPRVAAEAAPPQAPKLDLDADWDWTMDFVFGQIMHKPEFAEMMKMLGDPGEPPAAAEPGPGRPGSRVASVKPTGKGIFTAQGWKETAHAGGVTSGLGWSEAESKPADIMASPGTAVYAPTSGRIVKIGSAQEGGASYTLIGDDGYMYWLGHIDTELQVGDRFKKNQRIATVSGEHPRPHLHIDRRRYK